MKQAVHFPSVKTEYVAVESGFGYIESGHGSNGKKRWLMSGDDVLDMLLWSYAANSTSKHPHSPDDSEEGSIAAPKRSRYDKQIDKLREVEEIEEKVRSKNEGKYIEEQIRM